MRIRGRGDASADSQTGDANDVTASMCSVSAAMAAAAILVRIQSEIDWR